MIKIKRTPAMADAKTWIDVIDTAVKIGLGALIGGFLAVWLAKINNKHQLLKDNKERKRRLLEEVLESIDEFNKSVTKYWANRANAAWKIENQQTLTRDNKDALEEQESKLFNDFTIVNSCSAKLLLIGAKDAEKRLSEYRKPIDELFRIAAISNSNCTEQKLLELRDLIFTARNTFFESLNKEYDK